MPQREEPFYNAYSYGDKLEPGQKMTLEHHISFNPYRADLSSLTEMTLGDLQVMREKSVAEERKIFGELQEQARLWEAQAAQTMVLEKAMEYVKTPEVKNSGNRWEDTEYGWRRISNRVYQMTYRIREDTAYDHKLKKQVPVAWYVSWSVEYNLPPRKDPYYSRPSPLAGQDNKRYGDKAAAERYVQGRIAAYAHLFQEISPPLPENHVHLFSVNGKLLPGYTVQPHQPTPQELLAFVEDGDTPPKKEAKTKKRNRDKER